MTTTPTKLSAEQVTQATETEQKKSRHHEALPVRFVRITEYTSFVAEFAIKNGDLVFHFFVTDEVNALTDPKKYWLKTFPETLSATAEAYFKASFPKLRAAYTEEQASWWLQADGYGLVLDPHRYSYKFLSELDSALDAASTK